MIEFKRAGFINQYPPLNVLNVKDKNLLFAREDLHLYIHIPFCKVKCAFCYYLSFPINNNTVDNDYIEALLTEMDMYSHMPEFQSKRLRSVYFGGGTPSLLSNEQIQILVTAIYKNFECSGDIEFCFEVGPDFDLSLEKLMLLKTLGINRISMGCQSTDEIVLQKNGRWRTVANFYRAYELVRRCNFRSINIDIMSGLISQTCESFVNTVKDICALQPENISVYKLEIYLNNELYKQLRNKEIELTTDKEEIQQVREGYKYILNEGYSHANHFNFYKHEKYDHVQRREVWRGADMLGIGLSSHSNINGFLYQNESNMDRYIKSLNLGFLPIKRAHKMSGEEKIAQKMILGIKNSSIDRKAFYEQFGVDPCKKYANIIDDLLRNNLINITDNELSLTFEGLIFADDIARLFYLPQHTSLSLAHIQR